MQILIVDDSQTDVYATTKMLEKAGYDVISAQDAASGISMAEDKKPDLILMDIIMPGTNGFQATRHLSKADTTKDIPVLIVTTKGQETDRVWGLRQGAKDYLVKPLDEAQLLASVEKHLSAA